MKSSEDVLSRRDREVSAESVRKQLERVLASDLFRPSAQHQLLLKTIVNESLAGRTEALKEVVLARDVLGRPDYDPSRHTQVRVAVKAVRDKLAEYYAHAGIEDRVHIDIPLGHYVAVFSEFKTATEKRRTSRQLYALLACGAIGLAIVAGTFWRNWQASSQTTRVPVQVTFDTNWTAQPAVSRDGSVIVYSSDRGERGDRDIWLQRAGETPRQLTNNPAHDMTPDISPDGKQVVFRSWRKDEGIWLMAAAGGEARLVAQGGYSPRFSPDGKWIAFNRAGLDGTSHIFMVGTEGGSPEQLDYGTIEANCPVWSPDASRIIFEGRNDHTGEFDLWLAKAHGVNGEAARPLGIQAQLRTQNLPGIYSNADCPQDWIDNRLLFVTHQRETSSLFQIYVGSAGGAGEIRAVPSAIGAEGVRAIRDSNGQLSILFAMERRQTNIWATNLTGSARLQQLTHDSSLTSGFNGTWPALSGDGNVLGFITERTGSPDICLKDLQSGREQLLNASPEHKSPVFLNQDGSQVIFLRGGNSGTSVILRSVTEKTDKEITKDCPVLHDWSRNGNYLICRVDGKLFEVNVSKPSDRTPINLARSPLQARLSPDGRWVAFVSQRGDGDTTDGSVAQVDGSNRVSVISAAEQGLSLHWSPNGNAIYYWSLQDGFRCLYSQQLNPVTKILSGDPIAVLHRHASQNYPWSGGTLAVGSDRIVMTLKEEMANIWKVDLPR